VRKGHMERLAERGNAAARSVLRLLSDPDRAIAGAQVGITVSSILLGIVAEEPLQYLLEPTLTRLFALATLPPELAGALGALLVLLLLSFLHMVLGEQTPKTIALRFPAQAALITGRFMEIFAHLAAPLVWIVDQSTTLVLKTLGIGGQTGGHGIHTIEELKEVVRESEDEGIIRPSEKQMVLRAIEFGSRYVREAMIPRPEIVGVEKKARIRDLLQQFKQSRHSRFPVYEEDLDHICGVVGIKELLPILADNPELLDCSLLDLNIIQPAMFVPESKRIGELFQQMRRERKHMAIVLDEFGGTAGLVTSEELAEEVVGRLIDEWVSEAPQIAQVGGGVYEIDAQSRVDEVNEALGLGLPTSSDYETVAGFILFQIRRIPKVGEVIPYGNLRLTVIQMSGRKIERVRVEQV